MAGTEFAPSTEDEHILEGLSAKLADELCAALGPWVQRTIVEKRQALASGNLPPELEAAASAAAAAASTQICPQIRQLLNTDLDFQQTSPLALARGAVKWVTATLDQFGTPVPVRDPDAVRIHPDDLYDAAPASFQEIDPALLQSGIEWGAAKAHVFLTRRGQQR